MANGETVHPGQVYLKGGARLKTSQSNVHDTTPTAAQITTAFGAPSAVGEGFIGVIHDAAGDTNMYLVVSSGTSWFWLAKPTKAV